MREKKLAKGMSDAAWSVTSALVFILFLMRLQSTMPPPTDQIAEKGTCGDHRGEGGAGGRSHGERYPALTT